MRCEFAHVTQSEDELNVIENSGNVSVKVRHHKCNLIPISMESPKRQRGKKRSEIRSDGEKLEMQK